MNFYIVVDIVVEKTTGKFAPKEEIEDQILDAIEGADYGSWNYDDSTYETVEWEVSVK